MPGSLNNKNMASQDDLMAIALSQSASERALDAGAGEVPPGGPDFTKLGFGCWQLGSKGADDYWGLEFTDEMADDLVRLATEIPTKHRNPLKKSYRGCRNVNLPRFGTPCSFFFGDA